MPAAPDDSLAADWSDKAPIAGLVELCKAGWSDVDGMASLEEVEAPVVLVDCFSSSFGSISNKTCAFLLST